LAFVSGGDFERKSCEVAADPFASEWGLDVNESRNVSAGTSQVGNETAADSVGDGDKHNRNCAGFLLERCDGLSGMPNNDVRL
jgi:hypothetical protein